MDNASPKASRKVQKQASGFEERYRASDTSIAHKRGDTLGLRAFEKISAVEGIRLSDEMRRDLDAQHMDDSQRSRFILGKYGKP